MNKGLYSGLRRDRWIGTRGERHVVEADLLVQPDYIDRNGIQIEIPAGTGLATGSVVQMESGQPGSYGAGQPIVVYRDAPTGNYFTPDQYNAERKQAILFRVDSYGGMGAQGCHFALGLNVPASVISGASVWIDGNVGPAPPASNQLAMTQSPSQTGYIWSAVTSTGSTQATLGSGGDFVGNKNLYAQNGAATQVFVGADAGFAAIGFGSAIDVALFRLSAGAARLNGTFAIVSQTAAGTGAVVLYAQGLASQTGDLFQVQASTGTVLTSHPAGGGIATAVITSGALPTTTFTSGTGKQISTVRDVDLAVPVTATAIGGSCKVELSPDNVTYTTLGTQQIGVNGETALINITVPKSWYVRLTATSATLGTASYY